MRRFICYLAVLALLGGVSSARADFAADHPEYFGLTDPPPGSFVLPSLHEYGIRYAVRIGDLPVYWQLHVELDGEKLLFVVGGDDELSQLEAYVEEYPLQPAALGFLDVLALDSKQIGEFFPFLITDGAVSRVVDARYGIKNQQDDAAGSKLAELWESCAYRPPIFLTRGYVIALGEGRCIISKSVYSRTPSLTPAEVDGQLRGFLGCQQIVALQALQKDGEGRLDTYVRQVAPEVILVGVYDAIQDSANQYIMSQAAVELEEALGDSFTVETVAMPDPIALGGETLRPSYLHYVQTATKLIVPTFKGNDSWQTKAVNTLQKHTPKLALVFLDATELTYSSSRLTSIVAPYPDLPLDDSCESPEIICQSGSPLECGPCFNECWKSGKSCVSPTDYGKCVLAEDACYDLAILVCPEGSACSGEGSCEAGPGDCSDIPPGGTCEGDVIQKCVGDTLIQVDCGKNGEFCTINEAAEAICFLPCFDDCIPETTFCDNDATYFCQSLPAGGEDCGQRVLQELCENGTVCVAGACVQPVVDGDPDVKTGDGSLPAVDEDLQDWTAGYDEKKSSCSSGPLAAGSWPALFALLLLVALCHWLRYRAVTSNRT